MSHVVNKYNPDAYKFYKLISDLFNVYHLTQLHFIRKSLCDGPPLNQSNEAETFFHNKFYAKLKEGWPEIFYIKNSPLSEYKFQIRELCQNGIMTLMKTINIRIGRSIFK